MSLQSAYFSTARTCWQPLPLHFCPPCKGSSSHILSLIPSWPPHFGWDLGLGIFLSLDSKEQNSVAQELLAYFMLLTLKAITISKIF